MTIEYRDGTGSKPLLASKLSRQRIRAVLRHAPPAMNLRDPPLRPAAVLMPIVDREEPTLLFTRRTEHLPSHAGQVCFPGGRRHGDDETLIQTALREMQEEIGLAPESVEVAGFLDCYETLNTGFLILPVVGFLSDGFQLSVNPHEVAEIFEAPLAFVLDPKNHMHKFAERGGVMREFYAIQYRDHTIWGATAAMIVNLSERLGFA